MNLYTVCVHGLPVLVMSVGTEPSLENSFTRNPEFMKPYRDTQALRDNNAMTDGDPDVSRHTCDLREVDKAINTWLGKDLRTLEYNGRNLWNGNREQLTVREATTEEAARWHSSRQSITDEIDDWLMYLIQVESRT